LAFLPFLAFFPSFLLSHLPKSRPPPEVEWRGAA
jgi:hypothetical protein